jgi:hypothetical protein
MKPTSSKLIQRDIQEDNWAGDREASSKDFQRDAENKRPDLVEGSAPSLKKKELAGTHCNPSPQKGERLLGCSGRTTLRREQCDVLPKKPACSDVHC